MSQKTLLVFISGYPGSGKTHFADSLLKSLQEGEQLKNRACKFKEVQLRWQSRPLSLMWRCVRHVWLLVCVSALLQSAKGVMNVRTFPQTLKDAVRITSSHSSYLALLQDPPTQIVLIDEPPWHKLWIKIFPNLNGPWIGVFNYVIQQLLPPKCANVSSVFIQLTVPRDLYLERIKNRDSPGSRFNNKTDDELLKKLQGDQIYPLIFEQIKRNVVEGSVLIENSKNYNHEYIYKIILKKCVYQQ